MTAHTPRRRALRGGGVAAVALVTVGLFASWAGPVAAGSGVTRPAGRPAADRVLVLSLPHVSWSDLADVDVPHLRRLFRTSALANLTTRTIDAANLASGYITLGAGTRAAAPGGAFNGAGLGVDEQFGDERAGAVFHQRTGIAVSSGVVHLGIAPIETVNDDEDVDVHIGALGDALRREGVDLSVVGNADTPVPGDELASLGRYVVAAAMDSDGHVPVGRVDDGLLRDDPESPFGVRLDLDAVLGAFREVWHDRSVVVVEASDLARAEAADSLTTDEQQRVEQRAAIRRADALVGRLLEEVDLERDAVLVLSPAPAFDGNRLTATALHAPGREIGRLRTASTRRNGYVLLADVAPTVLDVLGLERDRDMQGRPFRVTAGAGTLDQRLDRLVDASEAADLRERVRTAVNLAFIAMQALLGLVTFWLLRRGLDPRARRRLRFGATGVLAFVPCVYLVKLLPLHEWGIGAYATVLAVATLALAVVYEIVARDRDVDRLLVALGAIMGLLVIDVVTGARLQLDTAFGYGPTVGVRIAGFGNVSFAALAASAILGAGLLAHRIGGRRGAIVATVVVAVAVLVDANPLWGSDVGGVIVLGVASAATALLLLGREVRLRARVLVIGVGVAVLGLVAATAIDLTRPADQRTHLGRLVEQINDEGPSVLTNVIFRKMGRNVATLVGSEWLAMLVIALPFVWYLVFRAPVRVARVVEAIPTMRAALTGFTIAAVLGYALNDTGIVVPGVMLGILTPTLVVLLLAQVPDRRRSAGRRQSVSTVG